MVDRVKWRSNYHPGAASALSAMIHRLKNLVWSVMVSLPVLVANRASSEGFHPGQAWNDTDGKPINAHGGGVLFHDGVYYWYGEFKTGTTYLPDCNKSWGGTRVDVT